MTLPVRPAPRRGSLAPRRPRRARCAAPAAAPPRSPRRRRRGVGALELLLALAIAGILLAASAPLLRPDPARAVAGRIRALALAARLDALQRGVPSALVFEAGAAGAAFALRRGDDPERIGDLCRAGALVRRETLPALVRVTPLRADLVWLPSGYGRDCRGGGVVNGTIRVEGRRTAYALRLSSGGRLRLERLR